MTLEQAIENLREMGLTLREEPKGEKDYEVQFLIGADPDYHRPELMAISETPSDMLWARRLAQSIEAISQSKPADLERGAGEEERYVPPFYTEPPAEEKAANYGPRYPDGTAWDVHCGDCRAFEPVTHAGGVPSHKCTTLGIMVVPEYGCEYANRRETVSILDRMGLTPEPPAADLERDNAEAKLSRDCPVCEKPQKGNLMALAGSEAYWHEDGSGDACTPPDLERVLPESWYAKRLAAEEGHEVGAGKLPTAEGCGDTYLDEFDDPKLCLRHQLCPTCQPKAEGCGEWFYVRDTMQAQCGDGTHLCPTCAGGE